MLRVNFEEDSLFFLQKSPSFRQSLRRGVRVQRVDKFKKIVTHMSDQKNSRKFRRKKKKK